MDKDLRCSRERANRVPFPAADPSYRAARLRCAMACRNYNAQPEDASPEQRAKLWSDIISPTESILLSDEPPLADGDTVLHQFHTGQTRSYCVPTEVDPRSPIVQGLSLVPAAQADDALGPHSPAAHLRHTCQSTFSSVESRLGPSAPTTISSTLHSPPPSPGAPHLPLEAHGSAEHSSNYLPADTPPPSRRASRPEVLVRDTGPLSHAECLDLIPASADTKRSNPFSVKAPYVKTPVYIDYGINLQIAASTFINRNLTVIDSPATRIIIGERCMIGPNVTLAGVGHPLDPAERRGPTGAPSYASDIGIGDDTWVGASVIILGGVTIGAGCVIGAGSVVTRNIPPGCLALGVPARVVRRVTASDQDSDDRMDPDSRTVSCQTCSHKTPVTTRISSTAECYGLLPSGVDTATLGENTKGFTVEERIFRIELALISLGVAVLAILMRDLLG